MMKKQISVLGCTGSIGRQSLDVIASHPEEMTLFGIAANRDIETLLAQAKKYLPRVVACETEFDASLLPSGVEAVLGAAQRAYWPPCASGRRDQRRQRFSALAPLLPHLRRGQR